MLVGDVETPISERAAHVLLLEAATVMLLLVILFLLKKVMQEVVQVKALLKLFSLLSPLTQTTMPQTRLAARTSR